MNWRDALSELPRQNGETLCYGRGLGYFVATFSAFPEGGGSWEDDGGEIWFAAPDQITDWCEITPPERRDERTSPEPGDGR